MSQIHRIQWFDQQIRVGGYPNSGSIAEKFEISRRQAQRDIEYMESTLRAPLVYLAKHRGYTYEDQTYVLPHLYMTEEEKKVLRFLVHRYRQYNYDNAEAARRVAHLLDRFTGEEETEIYSRLPLFDANPKLLQTMLRLSSAIREARAVRLGYEGSSRTVHPLRLLSHYNTDYVAAYCESTSKHQLFRLDGIDDLTVTDRSFDPAESEAGMPEAEALPVRKPFTARLRLKDALAGGNWNGFTARASEEAGVYEVDFHDIDAFMRHLATASWEAILAPKWLKNKLRERCADMLNRIDGGNG
ncbi:WYL domain-containing protein [Cohnella lubricantis]|uniref:WYL domain-containing protein n=1 Tax=Cohnella lubricantis TaxID=2163172 RepID=A0A841T923_9BACL|nr:WYL domain-containing protein [Cohnella lubricantis]MBB6675928.1 WYL domain-containing protein [Cohnella lubricantis]MBP2117155.1 putative DNA-binding transcriptional regulator YafY [Cohnella lubricantis]